MGRSATWVQEQAGRAPLYSPGRPTLWRREHLVVFWRAIAEGETSEEAAARVGFSEAAGSRLFRQGGGMPTIGFNELFGRYLSFAEREEIAILCGQDLSIREVARRLGRAPSTISREVRRNAAATRSGKLAYRATVAQWHRDRRAQRPKPAKLATNEQLCGYVQDRLGGKIARPDGALVDGPDVASTSAVEGLVRTAAGPDRGAPSRSRTGW